MPAWGQGIFRAIPSWGSGPYEVILFTDYFCGPCRRIDTKAETLLTELLATGQVRLTFVDVPFTRISPVYAKYYLYVVNANANVSYVLYVRKRLFDAAQDRRIKTEEALIAYLKENKISWTVFDEKSVFPLVNRVIKDNKINATPTCVIKFAPADQKKYVGSDEIWAALTGLQTKIKEMK
ncbi:MAG: thioredoxin domain-containing protein [Deltaproteobacteria bacterium]|nr:thioredoxin domain-containing protein [Deltaproteobacteria bacterium]